MFTTYLLTVTLVAMVCALALALIRTRATARRTAHTLASVTAHRDYWRTQARALAPFTHTTRVDWNASDDDIHIALTGRAIPTRDDDNARVFDTFADAFGAASRESHRVQRERDAREFVRDMMNLHGFHTNN